VDVDQEHTNDGTPIQLYDCHYGHSQRWNFPGGGQMSALDKCMDATGAGNGWRVVLWHCHGGGNQVFHLRGDGSIHNPESGLCLDVSQGDATNRTQLILWHCNGGANQRWRLSQ
jgi:hypothetical protein